jgi:hypothetical protein
MVPLEPTVRIERLYSPWNTRPFAPAVAVVVRSAVPPVTARVDAAERYADRQDGLHRVGAVDRGLDALEADADLAADLKRIGRDGEIAVIEGALRGEVGERSRCC